MRTMLSNVWVKLGFSLVCMAVITGQVRSLWALASRRGDVAKRQEVLASLQAQSQKLQDELAYVRSDAYVEQAAREKLGMVRKGEAIVIMPNDTLGMVNEKSESFEKTPNWKRWWRLFF